MSKQMGAHLKFLRKTRTEYTQAEVASMLYMSRASYTKYELGESEPSIDTLKRLCEIFDVDVSVIVYYEKNEYI